MREQCEWQPILFVAKRLRHGLEQNLVAPVCFDALPKAIRFLLQTKLRGPLKNAADAFCRQISQGGNTATGMRQRHQSGRGIAQGGEVELDLGNIAVITGPGKEFHSASFKKDVENRVIERWIGSVAVQLPIAIEQIDFNRAVQDGPTCYPDSSVLKVGACLVIPKTKLYDFDRLADQRLEFATKFTREPTCLQFELVRSFRQREQRSLAHTGVFLPHLGIAVDRMHAAGSFTLLVK